MTAKQKMLAAKFLQEAAERYGNDGCNDWDWPENWTPQERAEFAKGLAEHESMDPVDILRAPMNYMVMYYLAELLAGEVRA